VKRATRQLHAGVVKGPEFGECIVKWVARNYRLPSYAFWFICVICVWLIEKLHYSSWVKFLILMAVGFPLDFLCNVDHGSLSVTKVYRFSPVCS
jgi:hypothetical protein